MKATIAAQPAIVSQNRSHISDTARKKLKDFSPEIRKGVLRVADADVNGPSVTPAAHAVPKGG